MVLRKSGLPLYSLLHVGCLSGVCVALASSLTTSKFKAPSVVDCFSAAADTSLQSFNRYHNRARESTGGILHFK